MKREFPIEKYRIVEFAFIPTVGIGIICEEITGYQTEEEYLSGRKRSVLRALSELYANINRPVTLKSGKNPSFPFDINADLKSTLDKFKEEILGSPRGEYLILLDREGIRPDVPASGDNTDIAMAWLGGWLDSWSCLENSDNSAKGLYEELFWLTRKVSETVNCSGYAAALIIGIWVKNMLDAESAPDDEPTLA